MEFSNYCTRIDRYDILDFMRNSFQQYFKNLLANKSIHMENTPFGLYVITSKTDFVFDFVNILLKSSIFLFIFRFISQFLKRYLDEQSFILKKDLKLFNILSYYY